MKYVITGGPGIGKTTVIEILASRGYQIVPETARTVIENEQIKNSDILPWKNLAMFQKVVVDYQIEAEKKYIHDESKEAFLDRSMIDGYAYCLLGKVEAPVLIEKLASKRYERVFILDPLPEYKNDGARIESEEFGRQIHQKIIEVYTNFGYQPIFVPVLPPNERVDFILNSLQIK